MEHIIPRQRLLAAIESCLRASLVTVLLGARQVGKTTLARMVAAGREAFCGERDSYYWAG
jgi:predicted AAA+ superfamily ATPase